MEKLKYRGKLYDSVEVIIDGRITVYAEEALTDDMEQNNDLCCDLDNEIDFYPTSEQLVEIERLKDDKEKLVDYLEAEEIYYNEN